MVNRNMWASIIVREIALVNTYLEKMCGNIQTNQSPNRVKTTDICHATRCHL